MIGCCVKFHTFISSGPEQFFNIASKLVDGASSLTVGGGFGGVVDRWRPTVAAKMHGILMRGPIMLRKGLGFVKVSLRKRGRIYMTNPKKL